MDDWAAQELAMLSQGQGQGQSQSSAIDGGWAQLPDNLVDDISRRLPVLSAITMGRVCRPWKRIIAERLPLSDGGRGLPWLLLTTHNHRELRLCFSILQENFWGLHAPDASGKYCWGSVDDWLIIVAKLRFSPLDLEIYLWNPFSSAKIVLPLFHDRYAKILLSASPDDPNCLFLLVGSTDQSIACWTPGISKWRIMDDKKRLPPFADTAFSNGHFYFVMRNYNICTLDARAVMLAIKQPEDVYCTTGAAKIHLHRHQVSIPEKPKWSSHPLRPYLVESCGELLMVCRLFLTLTDAFHRETHGFEVFKLDVERMLWSKMQGLGDRVLFLGRSDSRSFSAKDLGDCVASRIFFMNDGFVSLRNEWNHHPPLCNSTFPEPIRNCTFSDWGSFSMDTKCFLPSGSNRGRTHAQPPIWLTAPIWWFFTAFCTCEHQHINVARRTNKPLKRTGQDKPVKTTGQLEKKRKTKEEKEEN